MKRIRVSARARDDIDTLLSNSLTSFGAVVAARYRLLLDEAIAAIRSDNVPPQRLPLDGAPDFQFYPLRRARLRVPMADRIGRPRHVLVYRVVDDQVILVRVLHDAMDVPRHLSEG